MPDETIVPDPGAAPAPMQFVDCPMGSRREYPLSDILPLAGACILVAFVAGMAVKSCNRAPVPVPQPAVSIEQQRQNVALDAWSRAQHGPILRVREPGATFYHDFEIAAESVKALRGSELPRFRWLMPVRVGPQDQRQIDGAYCLVDDQTMLVYMRSWLESHPAQPAPAVKP